MIRLHDATIKRRESNGNDITQRTAARYEPKRKTR